MVTSSTNPADAWVHTKGTLSREHEQDCPEELVELRATLLQEHVWRQREGL